MKVLLAGKFVPTGPRPIGGLQSWIKTVRAELERRGHECTEWQPNRETRQTIQGRFDLGILSNLSDIGFILGKSDPLQLVTCGSIIQVSHGIIPAEKPVPGIGRQVFTSEGVRDHWGVPGTIIRQPIDLDFWTPGDAERTHLTRYSYRNDRIFGFEVAEKLQMPYRHIRDMTHEQAREALRTSRLVFASGRAALEAMACGAPTVIYDHRAAYQGPMLGVDFGREMQNNYSGRGGIKDPKIESVLMHSRLAMEGDSRRPWVEHYHDARKIVGELLDLVEA